MFAIVISGIRSCTFEWKPYLIWVLGFFFVSLWIWQQIENNYYSFLRCDHFNGFSMFETKTYVWIFVKLAIYFDNHIFINGNPEQFSIEVECNRVHIMKKNTPHKFSLMTTNLFICVGKKHLKYQPFPLANYVLNAINVLLRFDCAHTAMMIVGIVDKLRNEIYSFINSSK